MSLAAFILSLLLAVPLFLYFARGDRLLLAHELFWTAAGFGVVVAIPIGLVEAGILHFWTATGNPDIDAVIKGFVVAAAPEELGKYLILVGFVIRHVDFEKPRDALIYGLAGSPGFALMENVGYVLAAGKLGTEHWAIVALLRAVTAVPAHAIMGVMMGSLVTIALIETSHRILFFILALIVPIALHGSYDSAIMAITMAAPHLNDATPAALGVYLLYLGGVVIIFSICAFAPPRWIGTIGDTSAYRTALSQRLGRPAFRRP